MMDWRIFIEGDLGLEIIVPRLLMAFLCGAAIGLEREMRNKPAGLRTLILICLGAATMMLVSETLFQQTPGMRPGTLQPQIDRSRIAGHIIAGIGFLGAGSIIMEGRRSVQGLTTAASIWTMAGIGMACGAGAYMLAGISTVIVLLVLTSLVFLEKAVGGHRMLCTVVGSVGDAAKLTALQELWLERRGVRFESSTCNREGEVLQYTWVVQANSKAIWALLKDLRRLGELREFRIQ